jgi:hypothetical protein
MKTTLTQIEAAKLSGLYDLAVKQATQLHGTEAEIAVIFDSDESYIGHINDEIYSPSPDKFDTILKTMEITVGA